MSRHELHMKYMKQITPHHLCFRGSKELNCTIECAIKSCSISLPCALFTSYYLKNIINSLCKLAVLKLETIINRQSSLIFVDNCDILLLESTPRIYLETITKQNKTAMMQ